jgi:hypothetical protein
MQFIQTLKPHVYAVLSKVALLTSRLAHVDLVSFNLPSSGPMFILISN